jgi:hypothetical protein
MAVRAVPDFPLTRRFFYSREFYGPTEDILASFAAKAHAE